MLLSWESSWAGLPEVEVSVGDATAAILKAADDEESTLIAVGSAWRDRAGAAGQRLDEDLEGSVLVFQHTAAGNGFDQD